MTRIKEIRTIKIEQIKRINELLGPGNQLSPESFDLLWECDIDELQDIVYQIEEEKKVPVTS